MSQKWDWASSWGLLLAPVPACLQIHQGNKTVPKPCKALETMPCMVALTILYSANASKSRNMQQFVTQSSLTTRSNYSSSCILRPVTHFGGWEIIGLLSCFYLWHHFICTHMCCTDNFLEFSKQSLKRVLWFEPNLMFVKPWQICSSFPWGFEPTPRVKLYTQLCNVTVAAPPSQLRS